MGVPPALPGRQQKFDISGGRHRRAIDETPNREQPSTRRGVPSMDDYESLSHSKHVHMLISIPPKHAVSQVIGFIKGKSAIHLARVYGGKKRNFVGDHFWARGYFVSTVGRNEEAIREYIKNHETQDKHIDQLNLW